MQLRRRINVEEKFRNEEGNIPNSGRKTPIVKIPNIVDQKPVAM
jgi:hypothetical protein